MKLPAFYVNNLHLYLPLATKCVFSQKYLEMKNYYSFFSLLLCWQAAAARKIHSPYKEALKDSLQTLY